MTLYEINRQIMDAVEHGCDSETGEIIDASALDALKMAREEKHENNRISNDGMFRMSRTNPRTGIWKLLSELWCR